MTQELHYTSLPRGLKPGSRGFCTVASTPRMPGPLAERLESLSGYVPVYPVHDAAASRNPINFMHLKLTTGGKSVSVLSRVSPAELDYSGRTNNYAHHMVLEANERAAGGPAWALSQPGFLKKSWTGEPRELPEGSPAPQGDRPADVARDWQTLTGDAGWAGVLAESFLADPRRPAVLVFRAGTELLPLFVEAIALLPAARRWDVEFSTYFTTLPQGVNCAWRGVLEGSAEAEGLMRLPNALVINLCRPIGRAEGRALVHQARTGERPESPSADVSASSAGSPSRAASAPVRRPVPPTPAPRSRAAPDRLTARSSSSIDGRGRTAPGHGHLWAISALIGAGCLAGVAAAGFFLFGPSATNPKGAKPDAKSPIIGSTSGITDSENSIAQDPPEDKNLNADVASEKKPKIASTLPAAKKTVDPPQPAQDANLVAVKSGKPEVTENPPELRPATVIAAVQSNLAANSNEVLFFVLNEPTTNASAKESARSSDILTLPGAGSSISKLVLKSFDAPGQKQKLRLEPGSPEKDRMDVIIRIRDPSGTEEQKQLAHMWTEGGKISFRWDDYGWSERAARDLLRDCRLEITTNSGARHALLRERPSESHDPLRIPQTDRDKIKKNFSTRSFKLKAPVDVAWDNSSNKSYNYLKGILVISKMEGRADGSNRELSFLQDGPEEWIHIEGSGFAVRTRIKKDTNEINFTFLQNKDQEPDRELIKELLNAGYNIQLGLKIGDRVVEFARIGSFTK